MSVAEFVVEMKWPFTVIAFFVLLAVVGVISRRQTLRDEQHKREHQLGPFGHQKQ